MATENDDQEVAQETGSMEDLPDGEMVLSGPSSQDVSHGHDYVLVEEHRQMGLKPFDLYRCECGEEITVWKDV